MPDSHLTADVSSVLHLGHAAMRDLVAALPVSALDWKPGQETNSIATLVVHALDAERHLTGVVADLGLPRSSPRTAATQATWTKSHSRAATALLIASGRPVARCGCYNQ